MAFLSRLRYLFTQTKFKEFSLRLKSCYCCQRRLLVRLNDNEMGVRCCFCGASAVAQSLAQVFHQKTQDAQKLKVYELSGRGAFVRMLKQTRHHITLCEYFPKTPVGTVVDGVQCQDVQNLSFTDEQFDVCTSLEVFEHVENAEGFGELYRVLKPGGFTVFTVPIDLNHATIERTALEDGQRQQIMPPEYHSDKLRGKGRVFCYRNYGHDIIKRLNQVGFQNCQIIQLQPDDLLDFGRPVIYAQK